MKVVFTGKMNKPRYQETEKFKNWGIIVQKSITKSTDFLVTGERVGENKINKAKYYGITIITENDFYDKLENEFPEYLL